MLLFRIRTASASLLLALLLLLSSIVTTSAQYRQQQYPYDNEDDEYWSDSDEDSDSDDENYWGDWPEPSSTVDFSTPSLEPHELSPLRWKDSGRIVSPYAFRGGLPPQLTKIMQEYCERMGITQAFRKVLIEGKPYPPDTRKPIQFNGFNWYLWRPDLRWQSNMHWVGTQDEAAYRDLLIALGSGGFDSVLEAIGRTFRMDGISAYHVGFMAVSHCDEGYVHADFTETGGKGVHVIFPIITSNGNDPDLQIFAPDRAEGEADEEGKDGAALDKETEGRRWPPPSSRLRIRAGGYRYENGTALMIGDDVDHGTAALDYRDRGEMRMCISIYMADINEENAESISDEYSTTGLPEGDPEWLLAQAGKHWSATDKTRRLPRAGDDDDDTPTACGEAAVCASTTA